MKVRELKGDDIMMAYDGNYLSKNFGYSCANYNVKSFYGNWHNFEAYKYAGPGGENDEATFKVYTQNTKNISCFVCFDDEGKIVGRRMFFTGPSMVNEEEFEVPMKKGEPVRYLYGYYGDDKKEPQELIFNSAMRKYGKDVLYLDRVVFKAGQRTFDVPNYWIMGIDNTSFPKYPPIDHLNVSTEINAFANFFPSDYIIDVLKKDFKKDLIRFHSGYRFKMGDSSRRFDYTTWADHHGKITKDDLTREIDEEEDDEV